MSGCWRQSDGTLQRRGHGSKRKTEVGRKRMDDRKKQKKRMTSYKMET